MTVENMMPHVAACQIEYFNKNMKYRDNVVLSLHPHNDRGCGVANAEMCLLAGADRVEGTIFGNGERTGNVDIVTIAMNMFSQGVDPELDFSNMPEIRETYERLTRMDVSPRQPYGGDLVFTAFSGSHQDAIAKGMTCREESGKPDWKVPYLPIDPVDVGRTYDSDVIRFNSQSGKGGMGYILKNSFDIVLPKNMRDDVSYFLKGVSDETHSELTPDVIYDEFKKEFIDKESEFKIADVHFKQEEGIVATVSIKSKDGKTVDVVSAGNGRLDSVSNALKKHFGITYKLTEYQEQAMSSGSQSNAIAYVSINYNDKMYWGAGIDPDIIKASINALAVAVNRAMQ